MFATVGRSREAWTHDVFQDVDFNDVAALVAIHRLLTFFPNIYCFVDSSCVSVWFPVHNYRSLPIDNIVVVRCMVSQSWFVLFRHTWRSLASGEKLVSYGFHFRLMFIQSCAKFSPSLSYVTLITATTWNFINTICNFFLLLFMLWSKSCSKSSLKSTKKRTSLFRWRWSGVKRSAGIKVLSTTPPHHRTCLVDFYLDFNLDFNHWNRHRGTTPLVSTHWHGHTSSVILSSSLKTCMRASCDLNTQLHLTVFHTGACTQKYQQ